MATRTATTNSTTNNNGRLPWDGELPSDIPAEKRCLGSMMIAPERPDSQNALDTMRADYFFDEKHRQIASRILHLHRRGVPPDALTVRHDLDTLGLLKTNDQIADFAEVLNSTATAFNVTHWSGVVRETAERRDHILALQQGITRLTAGENSVAVRSDIDAELDLQGVGSDSDIIKVGALIAGNPKLRKTVIEGLLREGESGTINAAPKSNKSWLAYAISLSVLTGAELFGRFQCYAGRVLLIDNELHPEVLAHRIPMVAEALSIQPGEYHDDFEVWSCRGKLRDIHGIASALRNVKPGTYSLIINDAKYRTIPAGWDENNNADAAKYANVVDALADRLGCAWLDVHHSSKGNQAGKSVVDVGSGAGAAARAADAHIVLREHETPGVSVLEAAVRSYPPNPPLAIRWEFPVWVPDPDADPSRLAGSRTKNEERTQKRDADGFLEIQAAIVADGPQTQSSLNRKTTISSDRLRRLLPILEADNKLTGSEVEVSGNTAVEYRLCEPDTGGCAT